VHVRAEEGRGEALVEQVVVLAVEVVLDLPRELAQPRLGEMSGRYRGDIGEI